MTFWIVNKIITGYILSTSIFLLIILFNKSSRKRNDTFLQKSNLIIIVALLINIIVAAAEAFACRSTALKNVANNSQDALINYSDNCISIFVFTLLFAFLFQVLFFFRTFRKKITLTVFSILLLAIYNNFERAVVFVTSFFRDYLPSSWSTYYDTGSMVWEAVFAMLYFIVCWANMPSFKTNV
jgi:hypothetical protein